MSTTPKKPQAESVNIKIITPGGAVAKIEGKGDAAGMMVWAFRFMPKARREAFIEAIAEAHAEQSAREAQGAPESLATEPA